MFATSRKIQTAFRLDEALVARLKLKAKQQDISLNRLVEECLEKVVPVEPEWPKVKFPIEIDPTYSKWRLTHPIPQEDIENDKRLAYILSK